MAKFFKKKEQINVGIDIGTAFIKAVAIDKGKAIPELIAFSYEPSENTTASVKKAITKLEVPNISVSTSISGPSVIVRIVEMPAMTERELKSAVKFEAEKYIPYKLDEVITDFVKVEELAGGKMSVLLIAAKKSVVNERIGLLSGVGFHLRAIDIDSFAIMNAFLNSQEKKDQDVTSALINIGAKITNINIVRGQQSYLARDIQIAGNNITQSIAEKLNLDKNKAEVLKINPADLKNEIAPVVKSVFYNLLNEVRLSFDFYENHYGKNVQKVYISGGSSRLEGISDFAKDIIGGDIISWDPFSNINIGPKIDTAVLNPVKPSFAVAVGLGLRES